MKKLLLKYKTILCYLFFGICTTAINIICYYFCYSISGIANIPSTIIAWIFAVIFAYITNKLFVFESKSFSANILSKEILAFFGCRLVTGVLDVLIMYITVDVLCMNPTVWKLISNVLVIILNYIASKIMIFKK